MFNCLWNLWDWLDPISMENKKGSFSNTRTSPASEAIVNEAIPKHAHQHNTPPQHLRLLQYGLKIPNHQHTQINQSSHQHQASPVTPQHLHHHRSQSPYQKHESNAPNIIPNQLFHQIHTHQYPQKQENQQNHYHYQTTSQSPYAHQHNLNQLHQQNAQIWVPHQPPTHYHPQQQQQAQKSEQQTPIQNSSPASPQSKQKHFERKKGLAQSSRFPSVKRPTEAPVTIQGWLHKQGSEGLMLWKKRWFVLSEYCLFYYKGPGEEKLLGSILLPSYKVSICRPDDKVNRKYAFKCEHANMRTYLLAADSQELMMQWVRVLNMASLLQNTHDTDMHSQPSTPSQQTETASIKKQVPNLRNTPTHIHSSSNTTDLSNPSQQELSQYSQPLYANAPPKPRRLTDGYSSPSLELLDRFSGETKYVGIQQGQPYNVQPIYMTLSNSSSKSPINVYGNPQLHPEYISRTLQQQIYNKHLHIPDHAAVHMRENHSVERRTPDTYGRSKLNQTKGIHMSDYEDIYTDQSMYKRPLSPIAYTTTNNNRLNPSISVPAVRPYTPINIHGPKTTLPYIHHQQLQQKVPNTIPRPHSADFLEYEVKYDIQNPIAQKVRPKSSLDINRHTTNDNYFYTEERYAEKMRKSAQYLPKMSKVTAAQNEYAPIPQKLPLTYNKNESDSTFPLHQSNSRPINFNEVNQDFCQSELQPVRSRSVLSDGSLSKEVDMEMDLNLHDHYDKEAFHNRQELFGHPDDIHRSRDYDQFTRSASARLAQTNGQIEEKLLNREGKRKREESMKRLLEWKQRMLQSPLNRKVNQGVNKPSSDKCNIYYRTNENGYPSSSGVDMYSENRNTFNTAPQYNSYSSDDEASGSISITARDTFPRSVPSKKMWTPNLRPTQSKSITNLNKTYESEYGVPHRPQQGVCYIPPVPSHPDVSSNTSQTSNSRRANWQSGDKMNMSAGDLLGRTHEELVLLLIQLRRQSANNCNAIEACYNDIDNIQARLPQMDASKRLENLQKLEQIKQHLLELEKQYEKGKPLVNLVDNMVKLGSLYRFPKDNNNPPFMKDRLEFNQHIQERRLLAEERRDWNRLNPSQSELQTKVKQLYQLDRLIQEESETLQSLQHDKEEIERTLGGLRHRLIKGFKDPIEIEQARKQQIVLETELSRVHSMLAQNSRKLEETVAGNARLEQELLVLKQKLQLSKQQRSSPQISNAGDSLPCVIGTSAMLESDLHRVQQKVGDLQRQRQELSVQVRQLTDRSNSLQQLRLSSNLPTHATQGNKKKMNLLWRETDLDTMKFFDHSESCDSSSVASNSTTPLYINTNIKQNIESDFSTSSYKSNDSTSDDNQNQNLMPQEKQEIKTVRIVKRESERRQRDREKICTGRWDAVNEEEDFCQNSSTIFRPTSIQKTQSSTMLESMSPSTIDLDKSTSSILSRQNSLSQPSLPQIPPDIRSPLNVSADKLSELSPIFKSESAKQIIMEMATQDAVKHSNRRIVPKEKRRHYTAPHNNLLMKSLHQLPTDNKDFDNLNIRRARDDLDMERALRQRIDAPDVVRSTLSSKELKYNESTIDNILGTPNKIIIPERYVPEQLPQLSAEEQQYRLRKVESIKKMLSDTTIISGSSPNLATEETNSENSSGSATHKTSKIIEEKKQREHLLQLNQILAKQVMEMSKIVAGSNTPGE